MDGEHLHRFGVGLESPAAVIDAGVLFRVVDGLVEPCGQRGDADLLGGDHGMEQLTDVADVGQLPLSLRSGQDPAGQTLAPADGLQQGGHPPQAQHRRPAVETSVQHLPFGVGRTRHLFRRPAEEQGERHRLNGVGGRRSFERLEQSEPVAGGRCGEHAARSVDHGRDAGLVQRVADGDGVSVALHEHPDVTRADRHRLGSRCLCGRCRDLSARSEQTHDVARPGRSPRTHGRRLR